MSLNSLTCKNCSAPLVVQSRFAGSIVCKYCHTVYLLENDSISETGVTKPFEGYSPFTVGQTGTYNGNKFAILGRIRLQDNEDVWNEWFVYLENQPSWIEESGELMILLKQIPLSASIPSFNEIALGQAIDIGHGQQVFISEKGSASIIGIEGEFPGRIKPNDSYQFIQGSSADAVYMIEFYADEIRLYQGEHLDMQHLNAYAA